jgi:SAM-dependent methyltransferase
MQRSLDPEILDDPTVSDEVLDHSHNDLVRTHRWLGHTGAILRALRHHPHPLRRVMDVGCGRGGMLRDIRRRLNVDVIGVDLRVPQTASVPIVRADAVRDALPECDVAVAVCLVHHLCDEDFIELIRNVGRSAGRFVVLDLVRHPLPLVLFRTFVTPFICRINALDGMQSIRRSFTGPEMRALVREAVRGTRATVRHSVAPFYVQQMVDISFT